MTFFICQDLGYILGSTFAILEKEKRNNVDAAIVLQGAVARSNHNESEFKMIEIFTWTITLRNGKVLRASHHPFHFYVDDDDEKGLAEAKPIS